MAHSHLRRRSAAVGLLCTVLSVPGLLAPLSAHGAELKHQTLQAWEQYVGLTEKRIERELNDGARFLVTDFSGEDQARSVRSLLRNGEVYIRKMKTTDPNGREVAARDGMIHHWLGSIFVPRVELDWLVRWLQEYDHHDRYFQEVERSKLVSRQGDTFQIYFRLRRKKIITVVYNTNHTVIYRRHESRDPRRISSRSFTTRIAEVDDPDTASEMEKPVGNDSGFLWRLNSYWRFEQRDDGVIVECESLSLSRAIPTGLAWLVERYVESVPRESLENTLTSIRDGSRKAMGAASSMRP